MRAATNSGAFSPNGSSSAASVAAAEEANTAPSAATSASTTASAAAAEEAEAAPSAAAAAATAFSRLATASCFLMSTILLNWKKDPFVYQADKLVHKNLYKFGDEVA